MAIEQTLILDWDAEDAARQVAEVLSREGWSAGWLIATNHFSVRAVDPQGGRTFGALFFPRRTGWVARLFRPRQCEMTMEISDPSGKGEELLGIVCRALDRTSGASKA